MVPRKVVDPPEGTSPGPLPAVAAMPTTRGRLPGVATRGAHQMRRPPSLALNLSRRATKAGNRNSVSRPPAVVLAIAKASRLRRSEGKAIPIPGRPLQLGSRPTTSRPSPQRPSQLAIAVTLFLRSNESLPTSRRHLPQTNPPPSPPTPFQPPSPYRRLRDRCQPYQLMLPFFILVLLRIPGRFRMNFLRDIVRLLLSELASHQARSILTHPTWAP